MPVRIAQLIALMEPQLLLHREAWDRPAADPAIRETAARILEAPAVKIRLTPVPVGVEQHRMEIDPPASPGRKLDPSWPPIGLNLVSQPRKRRKGMTLATGVDRKVQVPVLASLFTYKCVNSPAAGYPDTTPRLLERAEHLEN